MFGGIVVFFDDERSFGFIKRDDGAGRAPRRWPN
jgi:cold shock CspA family protein